MNILGPAYKLWTYQTKSRWKNSTQTLKNLFTISTGQELFLTKYYKHPYYQGTLKYVPNVIFLGICKEIYQNNRKWLNFSNSGKGVDN